VELFAVNLPPANFIYLNDPLSSIYTSWTVLASDIKNLESFRMKCQRHIIGIRYYDCIRNTEIAERTGLTPLMDPEGATACFYIIYIHLYSP